MFYIIIDKPWKTKIVEGKEATVQEATEYVHPFDEYAPNVTDLRYAKGIADYDNARRIRETIQQNHDEKLKVIERNK